MGGSIIGAIVVGVVLTAVAFAHAIGPALMLVAVTPFDAIPFALFGVAGNLITYVPIIIFLLKVNPVYWGQAFLGTRIQQYAALFVLVLIVAHAMSIVDKGIGEIFEWLRKVTLFGLMGIFAYAMRDPKHLALLVKTLVSAMAVFVVLAALDFYLGVQVLPVKAGLLDAAALDIEYQTHLATEWRFTGAGYPVNRFSNYLLLAIFLGVGWFMSVRSPLSRSLALACTGVLVVGEILTVTRSGILGMAVGGLVMLIAAFRLRPQHVIGLVVVGALLGGLLWYSLGVTSGGEVLEKRFDFDHLVQSAEGRLERVVAALKIWAGAPFLGVGWGAFKDHSAHLIAVGGKGAHNAFTNVLAETGLLGFVPLVVLMVAIARRSLISVARMSPAHEFWRPYFLSGLVAQLTTNLFNDYMWERYLWISFAFVVTLEFAYRSERAKEARQRLEEMRGLGSRSVFAPEAGVS
jgi:O-antigen ligase